MSAGASAREKFEAVCREVCEREGWRRDGDHIEVQLEEDRRQRVYLDFFDFEDEELVRLYTLIGSAKSINPLRLTQALRLNFGLPHGALALKGDDLAMIDTLMVEDADPNEIEAAVAYLAETGDHFEKTMFGPDEH